MFCRLLFHAGKWDNTGSWEHGNCDGTQDKANLDSVSLSFTSDSKSKKKYQLTFLSFYTKKNKQKIEWILIKVVSLSYIFDCYISCHEKVESKYQNMHCRYAEKKKS